MSSFFPPGTSPLSAPTLHYFSHLTCSRCLLHCIYTTCSALQYTPHRVRAHMDSYKSVAGESAVIPSSGGMSCKGLSDFVQHTSSSPYSSRTVICRENTVLTNKEMAASCTDRRETHCARSFLLGMMRNEKHGVRGPG